jgi:hypothetical protein
MSLILAIITTKIFILQPVWENTEQFRNGNIQTYNLHTNFVLITQFVKAVCTWNLNTNTNVNLQIDMKYKYITDDKK